VWHKSDVVQDVVVQRRAGGDYEWYLVTQLGRIWRGDLSGGEPQSMPGINRCFFICDTAFAPEPNGTYPYLMATNRILENLFPPGRVYRYTEGEWWRYWWP
jgi:hypothetical protein